MAFSTSAAMALASATRSWLARDRRRTRRPTYTLGNMISASMPITGSITRGLVMTSMASAPTPITMLRSPMLSDEPTTVCTSVVSVVRRLSTSPVCVVSKNSGLCRTTCAYTALRKSAVMRSPSQLTM